jgi:cell division protein FtsB
MIPEAKILMQYLPPSLGIFLVVVAAGLMGLFRSMALNKKSYDDTVSSLQRQLEILIQENAVLRKALNTLKDTTVAPTESHTVNTDEDTEK